MEFLIEQSFSKCISQNDENFQAIKSLIGFCLYAGLGDVQPTLRNKIRSKNKPNVHTFKKLTSTNFI
jgi:hypothetical protein